MMGLYGFFDNPKINVYLSFTFKIITSYLKHIRYSPYQQKLWDLIKDKQKSGMGYCKISGWFKEQGYWTPRGHEFINAHVFSIFKKKSIVDEWIKEI